MKSNSKFCYPKCHDFRCTQRATSFRGKTTWCQLTNEACIIANCNYAACKNRQLLEKGVCGKSIKRKTKDDIRPEDLFRDEIQVRGKLSKKLGEKNIF
jgi:hypothetical protein